MVRWLYNILFTLVFWLTSPWLLVRLRRRGGWREGFAQRFGRYRPGDVPARAPGQRRIWLHAVSVGEVNTCLQFINALSARLPNAQFIVTTTTTTGMAELRKKLPPHITRLYFPVDQRRFVRRALETVRPDAVILVEREIWPNFLWRLEELAIPLFLINARMSERSYRAYSRYGFIFRRLYSTFAAVGAQTEEITKRLRHIGCREDALRVTGSMKFDAVSSKAAEAVNARQLLLDAGWDGQSLVLLAGSTHEGEEKLLAEIHQRLRNQFPGLFLVLVARHFERSADIARQLESVGCRFVRRSTLDTRTAASGHHANCLLVDSTGELMAFYAQADVVFVGKSICARGGQNPIEPASLGKAIVMGPHMQNFAEATQQLVSAEAAVQVRDSAGLEPAFEALLAEPERRRRLGENAQSVVARNAGATERTVQLVLQVLDSHNHDHESADSPSALA